MTDIKTFFFLCVEEFRKNVRFKKRYFFSTLINFITNFIVMAGIILILGYAGAAFELSEQCKKENLPIKHIGMVGAMGGTASGFILGNALLGNPFHVHVISVEYSKSVLDEIILNLTGEAYQLISENLVGKDHLPPLETRFTTYEEYLGESYTIPTPVSRKTFYKLPRKEGIFLEDVYTSKTLGGFLDLISRGIIPPHEGACYIHTGGLGSLFAQNVIDF